MLETQIKGKIVGNRIANVSVTQAIMDETLEANILLIGAGGLGMYDRGAYQVDTW